LRELPLDSRDDARAVAQLEPQIRHVLHRILDLKSPGLRLRIHGDLHLAQILHTGDDLIFIDFEGDNSRPLRERTIKRSPLQDVAGLLRSFHYAATSARFRKVPGLARHERLPERIVAWAHFWYVCVGAAFLDEYLRLSTGRPFLPGDPEELRSLLDVFLLRKAVDEVNYELINRPEWVAVALRGLLDVVRQIPGTQG
jgi:maltose alpha-D-glucosyltransferase/alpha-amylase